MAELTTAAVPDWNGQTGFTTTSTAGKAINPISTSDWVFGEVDNGETTVLQVGDISGVVDSATDTIQGTLDASWLNQGETVSIECYTWGAPPEAPDPQNKQDNALPNGVDTYNCSWDPINEWDVEPGSGCWGFL